MSLDQAYATCADITRREARNFSYGIALLPPPKRTAMSAVYAVARRIDDIADGSLSSEQKLTAFEEIRTALHRIAATGQAPTEDLVLTALADAAGRLPIPLAAFDELIDGCIADATGRTYQTFAELTWYCRCVAGAIGRLSIGVYDPPAIEAAIPLADTLGLALQLTNIVRDLREDRLNGRIYLPAEDLQRFDCRLAVDGAGTLVDPAAPFNALVRFEADRARTWYAEGLQLLALLDRRSAACTAAMAGIYRRLLERIAADPAAVRGQRLSLSPAAKIGVAVSALTLGRA